MAVMSVTASFVAPAACHMQTDQVMSFQHVRLASSANLLAGHVRCPDFNLKSRWTTVFKKSTMLNRLHYTTIRLDMPHPECIACTCAFLSRIIACYKAGRQARQAQ